mgnify:CR=1 FL=1
MSACACVACGTGRSVLPTPVAGGAAWMAAFGLLVPTAQVAGEVAPSIEHFNRS